MSVINAAYCYSMVIAVLPVIKREARAKISPSVSEWLQRMAQHISLYLQRNEAREKSCHAHVAAVVVQVGICRGVQ